MARTRVGGGEGWSVMAAPAAARRLAWRAWTPPSFSFGKDHYHNRTPVRRTPTTPTPSSGPGRAAPPPRRAEVTLLWDGLPAHRSKAMAAWLRRQRSWLVVEPLPGYAPDLNPVEACGPNLRRGAGQPGRRHPP